LKRFYHETHFSPVKQIISIGIFLLLFGAFGYGISNVSRQTSASERDALEQAISRGITRCYASEGSYPESLSYLKEHYGIQYDSERYFIDYQVLGENIFPDVTIIPKEE